MYVCAWVCVCGCDKASQRYMACICAPHAYKRNQTKGQPDSITWPTHRTDTRQNSARSSLSAVIIKRIHPSKVIMCQTVILLTATLALLSGQAIAQSVPQSCSAVTGIDWKNETVSAKAALAQITKALTHFSPCSQSACRQLAGAGTQSRK